MSDEKLWNSYDLYRTRAARAEAALRQISALEVMEQKPGQGVSTTLALLVLDEARNIARRALEKP